MPNSVLRAELLFARETPEEIEREWVEALRNGGFEVEFSRVLPHRSSIELDWIILLALPLHAFLSAVGGEVAKDLYQRLKGLAKRRGRRGDPGPAPLVLKDADTGSTIVLDVDLPPEAIDLLFGLELGDRPVGVYRYDEEKRAWSQIPDSSGD